MLNVNYGNTVSKETRTRIAKLMEGDEAIFRTGIPEDVIIDMMNIAGEKGLNIATGQTIEEASRSLPDNENELISEAAVLIKANREYRFLAVELASLIRYFDGYPMDPKVTWKYAFDSNQEEPVNIIVLKVLKNIPRK